MKIRHLFFLEKNANGEVWEALGTTAYCKMDARLSLKNSVKWAEEYYQSRKKIDKYLCGFRLYYGEHIPKRGEKHAYEFIENK